MRSRAVSRPRALVGARSCPGPPIARANSRRLAISASNHGRPVLSAALVPTVRTGAAAPDSIWVMTRFPSVWDGGQRSAAAGSTSARWARTWWVERATRTPASASAAHFSCTVTFVGVARRVPERQRRREGICGTPGHHRDDRHVDSSVCHRDCQVDFLAAGRFAEHHHSTGVRVTRGEFDAFGEGRPDRGRAADGHLHAGSPSPIAHQHRQFGGHAAAAGDDAHRAGRESLPRFVTAGAADSAHAGDDDTLGVRADDVAVVFLRDRECPEPAMLRDVLRADHDQFDARLCGFDDRIRGGVRRRVADRDPGSLSPPRPRRQCRRPARRAPRNPPCRG